MKNLTKTQIAIYNTCIFDNCKNVKTIEKDGFKTFDFSAYKNLIKSDIFEKIHFSIRNKNHCKNQMTNSEFEFMQGFCRAKFERDFYC